MTNVLRSALVLAVLLAAGAARAEDDLAGCESLLAAGRVREAVACFRRLADAPGGDRADVQAGLGRALLAQGQARAAVEPLRRAALTRKTPSDRMVLAEALVGAAEERMTAGPSLQIDVVPFLRDALVEAGGAAQDPTLAARVARTRGRAHLHLEELDEARKALASPDLDRDVAVLDLRARVAYAAKDYPAAAAAFEAAGNLRAAATTWFAAKDPRVVEAYAALLARTPGDAALLEEAIAAARAAGRAGALEAALGSIEAPPATRAAWAYARARLLETDGRPAEALARYREASAADPTNVAALVQVARLRWSAAPDDLVAIDEAERGLRAALALAPKDEGARAVLGALAARLADGAARLWPDRTRLDRALAIYETLGASDPEDADAWANLGNGRRIAGEYDAAVEAYDRALAANPYDVSAWNDRGLALTAAGRAADALASFDRASKIDPGTVSPHQNAGRLLWLAGDSAGASRRYHAALRAARVTGGSSMLFRFLLDRIERTR